MLVKNRLKYACDEKNREKEKEKIEAKSVAKKCLGLLE